MASLPVEVLVCIVSGVAGVVVALVESRASREAINRDVRIAMADERIRNHEKRIERLERKQ